MVMERVSRSEKQWPTEARSFGPELTEAEIDASVEELMILEFLIKQLFCSGLLDIYRLLHGR